MEESQKKKNKGKILVKTAIWFIGIWAILLVVLQIVLSPAVLTKLINNIADRYVDGEIDFGKTSASVFRNFPNLNITLDDVSVTYPAAKFSEYDSLGFNGKLLKAGKSETEDTLACFKNFSASINLAALVTGHIKIRSLNLSQPRIFAKSFNDSTANWNIFKTSSDTTGTKDTSEFSLADLPKITLEHISLNDKPFIVYCNKQDTVFAAISLKEMNFKGKMSTKNLKKSRIRFQVDSLMIAGRAASDTLGIRLEKLGIHEHRSHYDLELLAKTALATKSFGRIMIPIKVDSHISFPQDSVPAVSVKELTANIAGIPVTANADIRYCTDSIWIKGAAAVEDCRLRDVIKYVGKNIWEGAAGIRTDASIAMNLDIDGWYDIDGGKMPFIYAALEIPESGVSYKNYFSNSKIGTDIQIIGNGETFSAYIHKLYFDGMASYISIKGSAEDLLGEDPQMEVDGTVSFNLDSLSTKIKPELGLAVSGNLKAEAKGKIRKSQMSLYKIANADLKGFIKSDKLYFSSAKDTIDINADSLDIVIAAINNKHDSSIDQNTRMLALSARIDSTKINYKNQLAITTKDFTLMGQNDAAILDDKDTSSYYPFGGKLDIGALTLADKDSSRIVLKGSNNIFKISPSENDKAAPTLSFTSDNGIFLCKLNNNRLLISKLHAKATATNSTVAKKKRVQDFIDSLAKRHPDIPRDSLFAYLRQRRSQMEIPDWLTEKDFRKNDFDFKLSDAFAKYYKEWDFSGDMTFSRATALTPLFPLKTTVYDFDGHLTNNDVTINNFELLSGFSSLDAKGKLTGLRGALLRNGPVRLNFDIKSDQLDINELLAAYSLGSKYSTEYKDTLDANLSDEEFEKLITANVQADSTIQSPLLVIPSNVIADISLDASNVSYSKLKMGKVTSDIVIKERCVQIKNTVANTNMGDMTLDGFYSTRTKKDIKTGFNINLVDITAEKVIDMVPAVDSIMPMLKSFNGMLNCEMAATASVDTTMNIIMPSLSGIIRIGGKNLSLKESESLFKILKLLKFKDIHNVEIDDMSVEGIISDNKLEIFPFVLTADRYSVALSGIQNLDQSFKYHISVLKSPLLVRFGVNLYGDFDNVKFKIGRAKYKNKNVPVFSTVIDQTKINLGNSIRNIFEKGVNEAVKENERQKLINEHKENINYENAVETQIEELSEEDRKKLEADNPDEPDEEVSQTPSGTTQETASGNDDDNETK